MSRFFSILVLSLAFSVPAWTQMPDVSQMSGVPLPTGDLPNGTVAVRVVRGDLSNNVVGQVVELHGGQTQRATTDESGRAVFANLVAGTTVHAMTVVDGKQVESQSFVVPATGGVRVILVAGAAGQTASGQAGSGAATGGGAAMPPGHAAVPGAGQPASSEPPQRGEVVFGGHTRFIVELADEAIDVYYLLDIANGKTHPVETEPVVVVPPEGARGLTVLDGSSPQAKVEGDRLVVTGPFRPGVTSVQFAYQLPYSGPEVALRQPLPAALSQTSVVVRKFGDMHFQSPQVGEHREMVSDGNTYIAANGGALAAGSTLAIDVTGLPYHPQWPKYLALALAAVVALWGAWLAAGDQRALAAGRRKRLEARREQVLAELVRLEEQHLLGRGDEARYAVRRATLVDQLDRIYVDLESLGVTVDRGRPVEPAVTEARVTA